MINKMSKLPIYQQIQNEIKKDIENKKWMVHEAIPAERQLALLFNVSRMTVRQAIQALVDEGILYRRIGSGTYVSEEKVIENMDAVTSFTNLMLKQGKQPTSHIVSFAMKPVTRSEAKALKLAEDAEVLRIERIRYGDSTPILFEVAAIPMNIASKLTRDELTNSLFQTVSDKFHLTIGDAQQTMEAVAVSEKIAPYLEVPLGTPVMRLRQTTALSDGTLFEYVDSQYVGNRFKFSTRIHAN
ncbi:GntR family transcriptional regulator [Brochothrix campestris]